MFIDVRFLTFVHSVACILLTFCTIQYVISSMIPDGTLQKLHSTAKSQPDLRNRKIFQNG